MNTSSLLDVPTVRMPTPPADGGLGVHAVGLTVGRDVTVLERISFTARPGTLTAVIGPSGSGKSTLAEVITGARRPTCGSVSFMGPIGFVPQDDIVHRRLTVMQALTFAAELRLPAGTTAGHRRRVIADVLAELELTDHAATRIDSLSGGQRKRVSVAMELLTGPSLLVLDEPTTGLDPALDRTVMSMLRRLADAGRVIVVVTHSLTHLDFCDQVLLLAPGGKLAFRGAPHDIATAMGTSDWAEIFTAARTCEAVRDEMTLTHTRAPHGPAHDPVRPGVFGQLWTVARRQLRLLLAQRGYLTFLALLPLLVGVLPLTAAGDAGLAGLPADGAPPFEAKHIVALTSFAAILMGITLTVRDLVGERAVFHREHAAGLSATAYLLGKVVVFGAIATVQSALLVLVVTAPGVGKAAPTDAVFLGHPTLELFAGVAATCVAASVLGLALSAWARTGDQVIVLLAITLMAQLVLAGGYIPVTDRPLFETLSLAMPGRWGFAATASTTDLTHLVAGIADDQHWQHTASTWLVNMAMLAALSLVFAGVARWRITRR
ncbi:ATP-binding cassette domain-containing protein [Mycolicibacterium sp. BiH015]|uniref:ATP-binding cassette domain-containing protein n=1 Tax=Mycolicibacterium sp. BiH015 TaxID=3018808 RepID=UPI0022DEEB82|nr:ATP-binding cassette domain-containing protein [Mycolicibacterium sp. BiH015]MDA2893968.1 ATP-binding cassette domain-containing protein [Mycolicibacterium sp. BiH015]